MTNLTLYVNWRSALSAESQPYYFPDKFTPYFRKLYLRPAVYRWRVLQEGAEAKEKIYIGEAEDLARRIQRVRTPSRKAKDTDTNKRLNRLFSDYVSNGRKIVLDVAEVEPFEVNGIRFDSNAAEDRFKRSALENMLLVIAQAAEQYELLNVVIDPAEKARKVLQKLPPRVLREILKKHGIDV